MVAKKNTKKKTTVKTVTETIIPTDDELFLGAEPEERVVKVVDYTNIETIYRVTNLEKNRTYVLNGLQIGAILGLDYSARTQLKEGARKVVMEKNGKQTYKIEVI